MTFSSEEAKIHLNPNCEIVRNNPLNLKVTSDLNKATCVHCLRKFSHKKCVCGNFTEETHNGYACCSTACIVVLENRLLFSDDILDLLDDDKTTVKQLFDRILS